MLTSGLVITLETTNDAPAPATTHAIGQIDGIELGELQGDRLPAALEAPGQREAKHLVAEIQGIAGVLKVDVVFVHFGDDQGAEQSATEAPTCVS